MRKKVEGYILMESVGKGSSGQVFRATHCEKKGQFAVKVIQNQSLIGNPKAEECLINEVRILSRIGYCQNIVGFHEVIRTKNNHYFVYDFCNGGNLFEKLKKTKKISQLEALIYIKDILSAYKVLYKQKVLHRDLKPENILFHNSKLKLADFGLCKGLKPEEHMTRTMLGSPIYMAPEILKGESYTSKADIWSLGVIFFEMLYGYCPYQSNSIATLISKIQVHQLEFPQVPKVNTTTKQIIRRMLNKDHFRRIGWIQLFREFLNCDESQLASFRSCLDQNEQFSEKYTKNNSRKISNHKISLCLIENNSTPIQPSNYRMEKEGKMSGEKENSRQNFNSAKFMALIQCSQSLSKRKSNFASPEKSISKISDAKMQKGEHYNNKEKEQIVKTKPQGSNSFEPKIQIKEQKGKNEILKNMIEKLLQIHEQFIKIKPYCQMIIESRKKENILDALYMLTQIREKLINFTSTLAANALNKQFQDLETMIKYQIIDLENMINSLSLFLGYKSYRDLISQKGNSKIYTYQNYCIEKTVKSIVEIYL